MKRRLILIGFCCALAALADSHWKKLPFDVVADWPSLPAGWNTDETAGVAVDADENVYVFHRGSHPVLVFDKGGKYLRSMGEGLFARPHGVHVDRGGNVWAVDDGGHIVLKMDPSGRIRMVLGRKGEASDDPDRFNRPTDVAIGPGGEIFVSDGYGNSRVVKYSQDGRFLKAWGKKGVGKGEFNIPHSIAVDADGLVYVADRENFRIQIFDAEGEFQRQWTHVGSPWGLELTGDAIYMTDGYNNRVVKLDKDGGVIGVLGKVGKLPGEFNYCHHIAAGRSGAVYTSEILNWRAQKFVPR